MRRRGTFITFEGGEGCGKSTHIELLAACLRRQQRSVLLTREPGGTDVGEQIRHVLQYSQKSAAMAPETELLLFCASRAQLVREVIRPALSRNQIVIADRFHDSSAVYQGVGRRLGGRKTTDIIGFAIGDCMPDLTVVIDLDPRIGLERARGRELFDRMENQTLAFYRRVRRGYLDRARREPKRIKVVDGNQTIEAVQRDIWELVQRVL